jgi:hypothetical protein
VSPYYWEVLCKARRIKQRNKDAYSQLRKLFQSPIQKTAGAVSFADLEVPDGVLNIHWVFNLGSLPGA